MSPSDRFAIAEDAEDMEAEEAGSREILTFRLGAQVFGIRVLHVREVLDYKPISPLANAPAALLGMIDVRGTGVPVVDLRAKLSMTGAEASGPTGDSRIVVLDFSGNGDGQARHTVAVVADAVFEVAEMDEAELETPPHFGQSWNSAFMTGIGRRNGEFLTLLDVPRLFADISGAAL